MRKSPRCHVQWLVGWMVGLSLLGACGVTEEGGTAEAVEPAQDVRELDTRAVTVTLAEPRAALSASEQVALTVTLTNAGSHPVRLLRWHTPAEGLQDALFAVTRDGQPVEYLGPHYKRGAPQAEDYLRLAPGESLTRTVDLASVYDLSQTGSYTVRYDTGAMHHGGPREVGQLRSDAVTVWVEGRPSGPDLRQDGEVSAQLTSSVSFASNCTSTQRSAIWDGLYAAESMTDNSYGYLSGTPGSRPRYTTWFGAYASDRWSTAKNHFYNIRYALKYRSLSFDCGCTSSAYAYVYPNSPYRIYLCRAFWSAPTSGTDSKGGTIVHELSHFNVVAGTDDWAYGQSAAKSLATSDPYKALDNADNHEYFAENTPYLN